MDTLDNSGDPGRDELHVFLKASAAQSIIEEPENILTLGRELQLTEDAIVAGVFALVEDKARKKRRVALGLAVGLTASLFIAGYLGGSYESGVTFQTSKPVQAVAPAPINKTDEGLKACSTLSDNKKESCLARLGRQRMDPSVCQYAAYEGQAIRCIEAITAEAKVLSVCDGLSKRPKLLNACIRSVAERHLRLEWCLQIPRRNHRGSCVQKVAVHTSQKVLCAKIDSQTERDACYRHFARVPNSHTECAEFPDVRFQEECWMYAAKLKATPMSVCESISSTAIQKGCYEKFGGYHDNQELVEMACKRSHAPVRCLENAASRLVSISLCDAIPKTDSGRCYRAVAGKKRKPELCEKVSAQEEREGCFHNMARLLSDRSLCNKIRTRRIRAICLNY